MSASVSVVIVSRGRPDALKTCLLAVSQLQYEPFEVVVVADPNGIAAARQMLFADQLKLVPLDVPNISAARNLGVCHAAGEIVAFIDDDAVPEPQWLRYLVAPAVQADAVAMGGFVRGRNGISFQWKARSLNARGEAKELRLEDSSATVLHPPAGRGVKTEGTNMAFQRSVLVELGGFDEAFHYFLDETDLNMRLARAGYATALVPLAEVHHGFKANAMRTAHRVPTDLFDVGASWGVFQRKHVAQPERAARWRSLHHQERIRLLRHLMMGNLEPRDIRRLMKRLKDGYEAGQTRNIGMNSLPSHPLAPFLRFPSCPRNSVWIESTPRRFEEDFARATERVKRGDIVTLCALSRTSFYHHVKFTSQGVWVQLGGIYGRSVREGAFFKMTSRARRQAAEKKRIARQRGLSDDSN
ncbi:MAG: glycosyltransferase [Pseudomonadota bacterium]